MAPKTRGKKDQNATQNDGNDGGLSYFQKTVCLHDWWLVKAEKDFEGKRLAVAGSTSRELEAVRFFTSAPIVKRYDIFTLETADGICVCIKGIINRQRTTENGFSSEVFTHFYFGFPPYWEECAKMYLGENVTNGIELEVVPNSGEPTKGSDPSLISTPIEHAQEVVNQDEDVHMSCVQNASKGSGAVNNAVNLSSKVEERSNLNTGVEIGCSSNVSEQAAGPVDASPAANTHNRAANLSTSVEDRITDSPSGIETDKVGVRKKKNKENISLYVVEKRITRSHSRITRGTQKTNSEVGGSMMQKDRDSTMERQDGKKLSRSVPCSSPSVLSYVNERRSPGRETRRKLDFGKVVSPISQERKGKQSICSLESLNLKCSRSGRVLLPPLEFWRNQFPVYDQNRKIKGIKGELDFTKPSGSRSEPQKRRKLLTWVP